MKNFSLFFIIYSVLLNALQVDMVHEGFESKFIYERVEDIFNVIESSLVTETSQIIRDVKTNEIINSISSGKCTNTKVLGKDIEGYSHLDILKNMDSNNELDCIIHIDSEYIIPKVGTIKLTYNVPARFIEGNWSDYDNGSPFKIELTEQGMNKANKAFIKILKEIMVKIYEKRGMLIRYFLEETVESDQNSFCYYIGTKNRLEMISGYSKITVKALF